MLSAPWKIVAGAVGLVVLIGGSMLAGRLLFPKVQTIIQPVPQIVEHLLPGQTVFFRETVPGPIREIVREITKIEERPGQVVIREVAKPVELSPADLQKARDEAVRRFDLRMEIPANQRIPCSTAYLVEGGMACRERIEFRAEILEPKPGAFVPIILPGSFAKPVDLTITTKEEFTRPIVDKVARFYVYPLGVSVDSHRGPHLVSGVSYSNRTILDGTYEVRAEYTHPGFRITSLFGWQW